MINTTLTTSRNGLPALHLETSDFEAEILFQGAHLTRFTSKKLKREMLWLSPGETFDSGEGIRGGVPIAFPWFGPHGTNADFPRHGFARNLSWQLVGSPKQEAESVVVEFRLPNSPITREFFPFKFAVFLTMSFSASAVEMSLRIQNTDQQIIECEALFHPYFAVTELSGVSVTGLEGRTYFDKVLQTSGNIQQGPVTFPENVDRIFLETSGPFLICENNKPRLQVTKKNINETVVWNPGGGKTKVGTGTAPNFVCVEPGCVVGGKLRLNPGSEETISVQFTLLD